MPEADRKTTGCQLPNILQYLYREFTLTLLVSKQNQPGIGLAELKFTKKINGIL